MRRSIVNDRIRSIQLDMIASSKRNAGEYRGERDDQTIQIWILISYRENRRRSRRDPRLNSWAVESMKREGSAARLESALIFIIEIRDRVNSSYMNNRRISL